MLISSNWLSDFVDHGLAPEELAERLTMAGLEVDGIEERGASLDGVVIGRVEEVWAHPNADRLRLCRVDLGEGEPVQIACGAPNVAAGQHVPVATVGTTLMLPDRNDPETLSAVEIKKAKLRGETSEGMICSEAELHLSDDHSGIMVLQGEATPGQPFAQYLAAQGVEAHDAVLDVAVTPNRPDATSHLGTARDLAALLDLPLVQPDVDVPKRGGETSEQVQVQIEAPEACPRYATMLVRGVEVKESPAWLKARLEAIGLRPRNGVVDVTNYVMHAVGQPLHAFDMDELQSEEGCDATIRVRLTEEEEAFTTLDDEERTLPIGTLLICDAERPVAIAGVMGGQNSEVTPATTDVLIESAYFDPSTIRRTAKALGLQTDSSYRFERGIDRDGQARAAAWAAQLIVQVAGGEVVPGLVDAEPEAYTPREATLRPSRLRQLLGADVPTEEAAELLRAIGFEVRYEEPLEEVAEKAMLGGPLAAANDEPVLRCIIPSWRPDVSIEEDLIEEVARLWGYDRIPEPPRSALPTQLGAAPPADALRRQARALLAGLGYRETFTNSLLPLETAERFNVPALGGWYDDSEAAPVAETLNPISQEMAALRPSLLPGLLAVMQHNTLHGQRTLRFMEWGHVFRRTDAAEAVVSGFAEHEALIVTLSGPQQVAGWSNEEREADVYDLKGTAEALLEALHVPGVQMAHEEGPLADGLADDYLALRAGDAFLGALAQLHPDTAAAYDLDAPVFFLELDWHAFVELAAPHARRRFTPIGRHPVVERDLAVVVPKHQPAGPMLDAIREAGGPLLLDVGVFDLYQGQGVEEGHKSVAFALRLGAPDRTLTDKEVEGRVRVIVQHLEERFGATLRS